jgi:hypothetical protein
MMLIPLLSAQTKALAIEKLVNVSAFRTTKVLHAKEPCVRINAARLVFAFRRIKWRSTRRESTLLLGMLKWKLDVFVTLDVEGLIAL